MSPAIRATKSTGASRPKPVKPATLKAAAAAKSLGKGVAKAVELTAKEKATSKQRLGKAAPTKAKAKADAPSALETIAQTVKAGIKKAKRSQFHYRDGSFVTSKGEKVKHVYINRDSRIPGEALMVGKDRFWVEQIPGISGAVVGPFPLPKGITAKMLGVEQLSLPEPRQRDDVADSYGMPNERPGGGGAPREYFDSFRNRDWPFSPGGGGSR